MQSLLKSKSFFSKYLTETGKRYISTGSAIPSQAIKVVSYKGSDYEATDAKTDDILKGKTVVFVGYPGAFTPVCTSKHLPEYIQKYKELKDKGADAVYGLSVNDPFVVKEFAKHLDSQDKIQWIADGNGALAKALGLSEDLTKGFLGERTKRFSILIKDGKVVQVNDEKGTDMTDVSRVSTILKQLSA